MHTQVCDMLGGCLPVPGIWELAGFGTWLLTCTLIGTLSTCPLSCCQSGGAAAAMRIGRRGGLRCLDLAEVYLIGQGGLMDVCP